MGGGGDVDLGHGHGHGHGTGSMASIALGIGLELGLELGLSVGSGGVSGSSGMLLGLQSGENGADMGLGSATSPVGLGLGLVGLGGVSTSGDHSMPLASLADFPPPPLRAVPLWDRDADGYDAASERGRGDLTDGMEDPDENQEDLADYCDGVARS